MKRLFIPLMALLMFVLVVVGPPSDAAAGEIYKVLDTETLVLSTGSGVSSFTMATGTFEAFVEVQGGTIRYLLDSTSPAGQTGYTADAGDTIRFYTPYQVQGFRCTLDSGSSGATVIITYFGRD